jgi:hypothetical protein
VPTSAQAQGNHTYAISFVPKEAKPHIVELKFNAENVPGSPFKCIIVDAARVNLVRLAKRKCEPDSFLSPEHKLFITFTAVMFYRSAHMPTADVIW